MRSNSLSRFLVAAVLAVLCCLSTACAQSGRQPANRDSLIHPEEVHITNLRQVTFDGENAEAYWSPDGKQLILQRTPRGGGCDQIYIMDARTGQMRMVSTGKGRTTCAYFVGDKILYSSTHLGSPDCPPPPDRSKGYVWAIYDTYDIFIADPDGSNLKRVTETPGYDAEATVSADGSYIVFTSIRDGDLDIYSMRSDGTGVKRLTDALGYDGGPFYSYDGTKICFRASRPETEEEMADYKVLLEEGLLRPSKLEVFVMNADGSDMKQVTQNGGANFCPFFFPDGKRIIYSTNHHGSPMEFDLFAVDIESGEQERITYSEGFDGFPMFSPDGKKLVFASNRGHEMPHETNIFIADWVE